MKKNFMLTMAAALFALTLNAQTAKKKVYDETINPLEQIDQAVLKAKSEGKFVICQVGGNWCPWCLKFAAFITDDSEIAQFISDNFVYIHVNYNPAEDDAVKVQRGKAMMQRLNNPRRFGFPVFVVLNGEGNVLHIQDSSYLEGTDPETDEHLGEGNQVLGYNQEKVLRFFKNWTPKAVKQ